MSPRPTRAKGEYCYDYKYDILFFKAAEREYRKSIEIDNIVVDIDSKGFVTGIQIFEASKFLNISKSNLLKIPSWEFRTSVEDGRIEIRLRFEMKVRNKIVEKNPIIMQQISASLPDSELICEAS
jgi:uncharacterized protein YuzE